MASIAVPRRILPSSTCTRLRMRSSKGFLEKIEIPYYFKLSSKNQPVRAMGMAKYKYKGTQMREKRLTEMIEKKVMKAKEVCKGDETSDECKVAWDQVEEVTQAKADLLHKILWSFSVKRILSSTTVEFTRNDPPPQSMRLRLRLVYQ